MSKSKQQEIEKPIIEIDDLGVCRREAQKFVFEHKGQVLMFVNESDKLQAEVWLGTFRRMLGPKAPELIISEDTATKPHLILRQYVGTVNGRINRDTQRT